MRKALAVSAALLALAGCGGSAEPEGKVLPRITSTEVAAGKQVRITAGGPVPRRLIAGPGDTITWRNETAGPISVRLLDGTGPDGEIPPGGTYTRVFPTSGTFAYRLAAKGNGEPDGVVEINLPATPPPAGPPRTAAPAR